MPYRDETLDPRGVPWDSGPTSSKARGLRLVLAWSLDEPERVGESALLPPGVSVLGRGIARRTNAFRGSHSIAPVRARSSAGRRSPRARSLAASSK